MTYGTNLETTMSSFQNTLHRCTTKDGNDVQSQHAKKYGMIYTLKMKVAKNSAESVTRHQLRNVRVVILPGPGPVVAKPGL